MKITDALRGEHGAFNSFFDRMKAVAEEAECLTQIQNIVNVLNVEILSHANLEERLLIPALEPRLEDEGPLIAMCDEHLKMERLLEQIEDAQNLEDAVKLMQNCVDFARGHFQKEEQLLFTVTDRVLGHQASESLGQSWAKARGVRLGEVG